MSSGDVPCISLPEVPKEVKITLPFGGQLTAFRDFSQGIPSDCTLTFNLLLQLTPLLAALVCPLKILKFLGVLQQILKDPNPIARIGDLAHALEEMKDCLPSVLFTGFPSTIKDILLLILRFLKCLLDEIKSILRLQLSIDLKSAEGNPVLLDSLICAQKNAQRSMDHLMSSIEPIQPLMDVVGAISGTVGLSLDLPSLAGSTPVGNDLKSIQDTVTKLDQIVTQLEQIVESLPG